MDSGEQVDVHGDVARRLAAMIEAVAAAADPGRWERRMVASVDSEVNRFTQGMTLAQIAGFEGTTA